MCAWVKDGQDLNESHHCMDAEVVLFCESSMWMCTKDRTASSAHVTHEGEDVKISTTLHYIVNC